MVDVTDWNDLDSVRSELSGSHTLQNDLDQNTAGYDTLASDTANSGNGWEPIGTFTGTFDGNDFSISDMFIDRTSGEPVGLFGVMQGTVQNVEVLNADVTGHDDDGGIAIAFVDGGTATNVHSSGVLSQTDTGGGNSWTGGLAGSVNNGGTVEDCTSSASVTGGARYVGGLLGGVFQSSGTTIVQRCGATGNVGNNPSTARGIGGFTGALRNGASITECFAAGDVTSNEDEAGGFIGDHRDTDSSTDNCYATGDVSAGDSTAGGFVGSLRDDTVISKCYCANASVTASTLAGGFIGNLVSGTAPDSFWDEELSNQTTSDVATAKTTAEMQDVDTYTDTATTGLDNAWDMATVENWSNEIWRIDDDVDYPELSWNLAVPNAPTGLSAVFV